MEQRQIVSTLERFGWRIARQNGAAAVLGINASKLRSRMRKFGIQRPGSR